MSQSLPINIASPETGPLNCMEVWGGRQAANVALHRPGLDIWVWSQNHEPAEAGGGDLHLLSSCASGRITRILLADVCGFGPIFSEIAKEIADLMKRNVNSIKQTRIVHDLSVRFEKAAQIGGFASMLVSTYFAPSKSLSLCNAGHPPPLIFRSQEAEWSALKQSPTETTPGEALVGVVHPQEYQQLTTKLDWGDMILSYSNVFTECVDAAGRTIGLHGLRQRVQRLDVRRPDDLPSALVGQLRAEHPENLAAQDATILLFQATASVVPWRDNLLAPLRLLRSVTDKTSIE